MEIKNFYPVEFYWYLEKSTNSRFTVQIIDFGDKTKLDSWIKNKIEESFGNILVNGGVVFIDKNRNYVFWRNDGIFVQIIVMRGDISNPESLLDNLRSGGNSIFPIPLINAYLEIYPSQCTSNGCIVKNPEEVSEEKIKEGLNWFRYLPEWIKNSDYYTDALHYCPGKNKGVTYEKIKNKRFLTDGEIEEIKEYCKDHNSFEIQGTEIPESIIECGKKLDILLKKDGISNYDEEIVLDECILREEFIKRNSNNYSKSEIDAIFNKRNQMTIKEVGFHKEKENEFKNSETYKKFQQKIDKKIEEKMNKRNISYFREENETDYVIIKGIDNEKGKKFSRLLFLRDIVIKFKANIVKWFEKDGDDGIKEK